jgi:glutathione synthase/RimK-type ligase-like ATP-grasp enzyme
MAERLQSSELDVVVIYWEKLVFSISHNSTQVTYGGCDILAIAPDVVIALGWYKNGKKSVYRDVAYSLALYLHHHGISFWNSEMLSQRSSTKLSTMMQLALSGIPIPATYFSIDASLVEHIIPLPYVAKGVSASRGEANYLIEKQSDISAYIKQGDYMIIQPFLPNDHDLRVICFNGRPELILRRARKPDAQTHLNNTSQGGSATWLNIEDVSPELLTFSNKICKITKREMAGIDLIPDMNSNVGYSCLEVNAVPQLTSGTDVDIKINALARVLNEL